MGRHESVPYDVWVKSSGVFVRTDVLANMKMVHAATILSMMNRGAVLSLPRVLQRDNLRFGSMDVWIGMKLSSRENMISSGVIWSLRA